jgi:hypothetical protein
MRMILIQTARTLVSVILLYGLLIAASFLMAPREHASETLDTKLAEDTIYSTQTKYLFFSRGALMKPQPRILIVGASNANVGLRAHQVQTSVPCALVNNLAVGNANATEAQQTVDLVHAVQSPEARLENTFVFGIWYGLFSDSKDRWPTSSREGLATDIETELYRYGLYRRTPEGPYPLLPPAWLPFEDVLIRPLIVTESIARQWTETLRGYFFVRPPKRTVAEREAAHFSPEERRDAAAYWYNLFGRKDDISGEQFADFENMIAHLLDAHERVIVVDLPLPKWHQETSVYDLKYRKRLPGLLKKFAGREGFAFSDISGLSADDDDYSDEVHPKLHLAKMWAERVGETIRSVACPVVNSSLPEKAGKK